ncbi:23S rRNA (uracil(747)-C(5))-methyltransferase RlmC [Kineococcus sp. R8]|uniref:23S rRNA (uracil(747)-C(5))-methyltransferase RlmC n=1 Tax=Kineococcus siccus TaxID=2696567 RepID=UPI00141352B1|nr:23S rRNA (uracil(747)-C(5))-methyltransferase RlmC [Kineococcus siccus]
MQCDYYDAGVCRSCTLMGRPYPLQLSGRVQHVRDLLAAAGDVTWLPPVESPEADYRNKAKMVVGGTAEEPTIGLLDRTGRAVDIRGCGVCTPGVRAVLPVLAEFIGTAGLTPYDVAARRGELKYLLVTDSPDGRVMVRFVLRSQEALPRLRKHLPALLRRLPQLEVVSANLLPEHKAVVEGDREVVLTEASTLPMRVGDHVLHLRPQSFFQTNTTVAAALYRQARAWTQELGPASVWDLYCGVGGFALHCAGEDRDVVGVETSPEAVASARLSAREAGLARVRFEVGDAGSFARAAPDVPELVVVNPPRRGLGAQLGRWLEASRVRHVLYSSCNATTLASDLAAMPSLRPRVARVLDMFPQTAHQEVAVLLERD